MDDLRKASRIKRIIAGKFLVETYQREVGPGSVLRIILRQVKNNFLLIVICTVDRNCTVAAVISNMSGSQQPVRSDRNRRTVLIVVNIAPVDIPDPGRRISGDTIIWDDDGVY